MTYRDANGHFISKAEAERLGIVGKVETPEIEAEAERVLLDREDWHDPNVAAPQTVFIDTGRGGTEQVNVGTPFSGAVERIAESAHYGGYFRVYLNGSEIVNPEDSPETITADMRIAITSYDKVG